QNEPPINNLSKPPKITRLYSMLHSRGNTCRRLIKIKTTARCFMKNRECREPMCETSERSEKLISREQMLPIALEIGHRLLEVFGYQKISSIVFKLKANSNEIHSILNGEKLPSTELLIGIHKVTGVSLDWLLTGKGAKYPIPIQMSGHSLEPLPS